MPKRETLFTPEHRELVRKLVQARKEAGLTQSQVAQKLNLTQAYISKLETRQRGLDLIQLKRLATLYAKPIDYFL